MAHNSNNNKKFNLMVLSSLKPQNRHIWLIFNSIELNMHTV